MQFSLQRTERSPPRIEILIGFPISHAPNFIPAKAVHAIGPGCLILEVQEPTDFTIQPERWCGDYHLSDNEMYIGLNKDDALSVFDYSYNLEKDMSECKKTPTVEFNTDGNTRLLDNALKNYPTPYLPLCGNHYEPD